MAGRKLEYQIGVDPSSGIAGLKQFSSAAKKAMKDVDSSMDDTTTSAQKVAKALSGLADEIETEMKGAAKAAGALSDALGPELAGRANVDSVVTDLRKMGLTFDEITADADTLAASLKKLDTVQMSGVETSAKRTKDSMDKIVDGADKTSSATANMVGNAGQDLGELAGISGTAGVALGQLAEGFADSAFAAKEAGQGFGAIGANLVKALGPIAAIAAVVSVVTAVVDALNKPAKDAAERVDDLGEAMANSTDDALGFAQVLRDNAAELDNFIANANDPLGGFGTFVDEAASHIPILGKHMKEAGEDVLDASKRAGLSVYDLGKQIAGAGLTTQAFNARLQTAVDQGKITEAEMNAVAEAVAKYGDAAKQAARDQGLFNIEQAEGNALLQEMLDQRNPMRHFRDQWNTLAADIADGTLDTKAAADAVNFLAKQLGRDPQEVISLALDKIADVTGDATKAAEEHTKALEEQRDKLLEVADAMQDYAANTLDAQGALDELASPFKQMELSSEGMAKAFALKNAPLDFLDQVVDIHDAMRDLATFIKKDLKGHIPNIFDPNDVNVGPFLDKINALRGPIQQQITDVFASRGPEAAVATADKFVKEMVGALGGKISAKDLETLWGIDNLQATIKVGLDQKSLAEAQAMLEILTSIAGDTAEQKLWIAQLKLDVLAGKITPEQFKAIVAKELPAAGLEVPLNLKPNTADAVNAANTYIQQHGAIPLGLDVEADTSTVVADVTQARNDAQRAVVPINIPVSIGGGQFRYSNGRVVFDAGGTVGAAGGIVGERRPEIINSRYLVTSPTIVPAGTRVTSGARTARILRHGGGRGLKPYDSGGTVMAGPATVNVHFNGVGAIGSRYELMRTVRRATVDNTRLLGTRG